MPETPLKMPPVPKIEVKRGSFLKDVALIAGILFLIISATGFVMTVSSYWVGYWFHIGWQAAEER